MRAILIAFLACLMGGAATAAPKKMVFFFFVTGKGSAGYSKDEIEKMQAAHLANIGRLYKAGILKLAGPCADPGKRRRGIVLMDVPTVKDLDQHFTADPYLQNGIMKQEAFPVRVEMMKVGKPAENEITQHTIAILEAMSNDDCTRFDMKTLKSLRDADRPPIVLAASEPGRIRAILFFASDKPAEVQAKLEALAPMKDGKLKVTAMGQWMGKGMLTGG